jgi:sRNA-binding regulator protein Hfq
MCVALIGGMKRLEKHYINEARAFGVDLKVFNVSGSKVSSKIKNMDALVVFTNRVSHNAKKQAMSMAKSNGIPVYLYHSCGMCTLRGCLKCLKPKEN